MQLSFFRIGAVSLAAVVMLVGLSSCTDTDITLPEGPQTMSGVLQPVSISLKRRGSHLLMQEGKATYYVESASKDLRDFEGVDVIISGIVERNTDPEALPVLVSSGVKLVDMPVRSWEVTALKLSIDTPLQWNAQQFDDGIRFTETGSTHILFRVNPSTLTQLPVGTSLQISGRRAVRTTASGAQVVYVQNGRDIIAFSYSPAASTGQKTAEREFNRVIRSVHFGTAMPSSVSSKQTGSAASAGASTAGAPCGGPAGVLCPAGQYCEITDASDGVGRCRTLKR